MIVKKHISQEGRVVLAVVDSELVGKKLMQGDKVLDLSSDFYNGDEKSPDEVLEMMKEAHVFNLVGEKSIDLAKSLNIAEEVHEICGVKYAMSVRA